MAGVALFVGLDESDIQISIQPSGEDLSSLVNDTGTQATADLTGRTQEWLE